jgi:hypothetical protein
MKISSAVLQQVPALSTGQKDGDAKANSDTANMPRGAEFVVCNLFYENSAIRI